MGLLGDGAYEAARASVARYCEIAGARLELSGRARLLRSIAMGEGHGGVIADAVCRSVVVNAPPIDDEVARALLDRMLAALRAEDRAASLYRLLALAAAIAGRGHLAWPEIALAAPLLEIPGAERVLREVLETDAARLRAMARGLEVAEHGEAARQIQRTDERGALLYEGLDGQPTTESHVERTSIDAAGSTLYLAPPEMTRDAYVRAYDAQTLWDRHFRSLPDGATRFHAWLASAGNRAKIRRPLRPLTTGAPIDGERAAVRRADAAYLRGEAEALGRTLIALTSLEDGPSPLVTLAESSALQAMARAALADVEVAADLLVPIAGAAIASVIEANAWRDRSPEAVLAAARSTWRTLRERLALARYVERRVRDPLHELSAGELEGIDRDLLHDVDRALPGLSTDGEIGAVIEALLTAQGIVDRGVTALTSLGDGSEASRAEARRAAIDLARAALDRSLEAMVPQRRVPAVG